MGSFVFRQKVSEKCEELNVLINKEISFEKMDNAIQVILAYDFEG